jgi:hypothetical protein
MAGYKIGDLSLTQYIERMRVTITSNANWQHNTDEVAYQIHAVAPYIPFAVIRKSYVRVRKKWQTIDEDAFANNFEIASEPAKKSREPT